MNVRRRHNPGEIVEKLRIADELLAVGANIGSVCLELSISEATYHRWRNQFGAARASGAIRLRVLERENATLRRRLADIEKEILALQEIAAGHFRIALGG